MNSNTVGEDFLKSLGFPSLEIHNTFSHYDFSKPGKRVLLIGPMGSGKTEYSSRIWRDAGIAQKKGEAVRALTGDYTGLSEAIKNAQNAVIRYVVKKINNGYMINLV